MAVTCEEVLNLKEFANVELVAGKQGMNRLVSWPYVKNTRHLKGWIYGGEMVFIPGIGDGTNSENLVNTVEECYQNNAAGLVVLYGKKHTIREIPQNAIERADKLGIPLYQMPYELKIIDVTKAISNRIILDELKGQNVVNFMSDLLYNTYISQEQLEAESQICGFQLDAPSFFAVLGFRPMEQVEEYSNTQQRHILHSFTQLVEQISRKCQIQMLSTISFNMSICLFQVDGEEEQHRAIQEMNDLLKKGNRESGYLVFCGFSEMKQGYAGIQNGFVQARQALHMAFQSQKYSEGYQYGEMGVLQFVVNGSKKKELLVYCDRVLSDLKYIDMYEQSDYVNTVRAYIQNNGNLVKTAQSLYIHRNTLINRMKKISKITNKNFDEVKIRNEYYDVFRILDFYGEN